MRILSLDTNMAYDLDDLPDEVEDIRYCILDNSDPKNPDYFYNPLIFMESFSAPAIVLNIGNDVIKLPMDWQILIGEKEMGDLEMIPLTSLNDRGFSAFCFNPLTSFRPEFNQIDVVDIYQDVKWYFPKLKPGHMLAIPLKSNTVGSLCVYCVRDISRTCEVVDYNKAW